MKTAIFAGSFDPFTNGHFDILKRGTAIFDKIIVAVAYNPQKAGFLPVEKRVELIREVIKEIPNTEVDSFEGLTVEYAKRQKASFLLRGLRTEADFDYETELANINKTLCSEIETVFITTMPEYSFISSSAVREIYNNMGDFSKLVPEPVFKYLTNH